MSKGYIDPIAESKGLKRISLEEVKKNLGLPPEAIFCGYLVHIEEKDEFLSSIIETSLAIQRSYVKTPELAQRFYEFGDAYKVARAEKNEIVVGLFDLGKKLYVYQII